MTNLILSLVWLLVLMSPIRSWISPTQILFRIDPTRILFRTNLPRTLSQATKFKLCLGSTQLELYLGPIRLELRLKPIQLELRYELCWLLPNLNYGLNRSVIQLSWPLAWTGPTHPSTWVIFLNLQFGSTFGTIQLDLSFGVDQPDLIFSMPEPFIPYVRHDSINELVDFFF